MPVLAGPDGLVLEVEQWGPGLDLLARLRDIVSVLPQLQRVQADGQPRLITVGLVEDAKSAWLQPPDAFTAELQSSATPQTLTVTGPIDRPELGQLMTLSPSTAIMPSTAEISLAMDAVRSHEAVSADVAAGRVEVRPAMPGAVHLLGPGGGLRRGVAVDIHKTTADAVSHRLAFVDLHDRNVVLHPQPSHGNCGAPDDGDHGDGSTDGMVRATVTHHGERLWEFVAVRPAQTGPRPGTGLSIRFASYKGREFLYRGDTPIVNVRYDKPNAFGATSYRDWMTEESAFHADGTDVIPGYRLCPTTPVTLFDADGHGDYRAGGNFNGVSFHFDGTTLVVTTMCQAGWYRYRLQWRFKADGSVNPTFGFNAVENPATCDVHTHHCYWRFDFDIEGPANNSIQYGWLPLIFHRTAEGVVQPEVSPSLVRPVFPVWHWETARTEKRWERAHFVREAWRVMNTQTDRGYAVHPGPDGFHDSFGVGDVWALRYHPHEYGDAGGPGDQAHIDPYVNGEDISNADVVLWYACHARHDAAEDEAAHEHGHVVGPTLTPVSW